MAWKHMVWPSSPAAIYAPETGVEKDILHQVGRASVEVPGGFVSVNISGVIYAHREQVDA